MNKIKREINQYQYQKSEQRITDGVFHHIDVTSRSHTKRHIKKSFLLSGVFAVFALMAFIIIQNLSPWATPFINNSVELTTFQNKKIAEIGYLSGSIIAASQPSPTASITPKSMSYTFTSNTTFESNLDDINLYFDMLRVFLNTDPFSSNITVTNSSDSNYDTAITFQSNGFQYELKLKVTSATITGVLLLDDAKFEVQGTLLQEGKAFIVELEAYNVTNDDHVTIHYATEDENEVETTYNIITQIAGIERTRTIRIERENNESTIHVTENNNEFQLEKEIKSDGTHYELQYKINDVKGSAVITEQLDQDGNITYLYQLTEGEYEEDFEQDRPTYEPDNTPHQNKSYAIPHNTPFKLI